MLAGAGVLEGADALVGAVAGLLVFFTFLTFLLVLAGTVAVWPDLPVWAGVEAGAWAANVKGMAATANPIANSVFFIFPFLPGGLCCPLTVSCCSRPAGNSIACAG